MFTFIRYLAIIAIAGFAVSSDQASHALLMHKDIIAAALIALLSLPTIRRMAS